MRGRRETARAVWLLASLGVAAAPRWSVDASGLPGGAMPTARLAAATGAISEGAVLADLAALRAAGPAARSAGPTLVSLLAEPAPLYSGRGPRETARLRRALLVTLAAIGPPPEALPAILAELAHGHEAAGVAAAARAAGALGPQALPAIPYLVELLGPGFHDDQVDLDAFGPGPREAPTTARVEAVRALARLGTAAAPAIPRLHELAETGAAGAVHDEALRTAARLALVEFAAADPDGGRPAGLAPLRAASPASAPPLSTPFRPAAERAASPLRGIEVTDHDGRAFRGESLLGQPLALTFFYTRCDNPEKCPLTLSRLARLQAALRREGLATAVRLAAMTYDPQSDDALRLRRFAEAQGFEPGPEALLLRPRVEDVPRIVAALGAAVNFGAGQVNAHGVQLFLFDRQGRYVRHYHSVVWDETAVLADLRRLVAEPGGLPGR